jgi:outer membrane lipoprotein-sorting protein
MALFLPPQTGAIDLGMRRLAGLLLLVAVCVLSIGAGQPTPARLIEFSDADRAELDRISAYLNSIRSMQGDFVQIGPNGEIDQGRFYVQKPGKFRFEYNAPSPLLIVSNGRFVTVSNSKLKTVRNYPLLGTPFDLILGDKVDLRKDGAVMGVGHRDGNVFIEARTAKNRSKPNIAIAFSEQPLELRQWTVIDDQGLSTTVAVRSLQAGVDLDGALFVLKDTRKPVGVKSRD